MKPIHYLKAIVDDKCEAYIYLVTACKEKWEPSFLGNIKFDDFSTNWKHVDCEQCLIDAPQNLNDNMERDCLICGQGVYVETGIQDDMHGILHCEECGDSIKRWEEF